MASKQIFDAKEGAEQSEIAETTISRLENGEPARLDTIARLADALGISREQFMREDPKKELAAIGQAITETAL